MGDPVSKIKGPRGSVFKRVTARRDMFDMIFRTSAYRHLKRTGLESGEGGAVHPEVIVEITITNQRDFDRLNNAIPADPVRETGDKIKIVDNGKRDRKRADPIFLPEIIDPIFHSDPSVALTQCGRGHANEPDTPVSRRRTKTGQIEESAASNRNDIGVAADFEKLNRLPDLLDERPVILARFAALQNQWLADEVQCIGMNGKVVRNLFRQSRIGFCYPGIEQYENL